MKYEDIKKMGEAYAQIQEKQRQENAKRAEEMLKQQEAYGAPSSKDDNDQVAQRKKLMKGQKNHDEGAKQGKSIKGTIQPGKKVGMKDDASNDKSDDGDGMDKVDPKAAKKKFRGDYSSQGGLGSRRGRGKLARSMSITTQTQNLLHI